VNGRTPASLPKHARLRKRGEYLRVQGVGRRHHTEHFVVLTAPGAREGSSRVGITVSTRVGNAVVRNRVKRMLREILRISWRRIAPPADVVVIAKPNAAQASHDTAATELRRALGIVGG
jgi:ribonuclease P protein component